MRSDYEHTEILKELVERLTPEGARFVADMLEKSKGHKIPSYLVARVLEIAGQDKGKDEEDECPLPERDTP